MKLLWRQDFGYYYIKLDTLYSYVI